MQKYLVTMMVFALTIGAQGQTETIDTARFMAVYDYQCRTMDDEGEPVVDSMEIVVQVGRTMTKSMPWSQSSLRQRTFEEEGKVTRNFIWQT